MPLLVNSRPRSVTPWVGMMDKAAAEAANTSPGEDGTGAGLLLRSASFLEKLEHARAQRQRVLAERAQNPDKSDDLGGLTKPWEKPALGGPGDRPRPVRHHSLDLLPFEKISKKPTPPEPVAPAIRVPDLLVPDLLVRELVDPKQRPDPAAAEPTAVSPRKSWVGWRVPAGFAFGAGLGLVLTWALPALVHWRAGPDQTVQLSPVALLPTAPAVATATELVATALPVAPVRQATIAKPLVLAAPAMLVLNTAPPDLDMPAQPPTLPPRIVVTTPANMTPGAQPTPMGTVPPFADRPPTDATPFGPSVTANADRPLAPQTLPAPPAMLVTQAPQASTTPPNRPAPQPDLAAFSIHVLAPKGAAPDVADTIAATLTDAGYKVTEAAEVGAAVTKTHIRYYHAADAAVAQALAKKIGGLARDFTTFDPLPPAGVIEVWIAAKTPEPATKKKKPAKKPKVAAPTGPSDAKQLQDLRDRLLKELQNDASQ